MDPERFFSAPTPDPTFMEVSAPTPDPHPVSDPATLVSASKELRFDSNSFRIRLRIRQKVSDPTGSGSTTLLVKYNLMTLFSLNLTKATK